MAKAAAAKCDKIAESSCHVLVELVLRCGALSAERAAPADLVQRLSDLSRRDAAVAAWLQRQRFPEQELLERAAAQLPELLCSTAAPPLGFEDEELGKRLVNTAALAVRVRSLEKNASHALSERLDAALYNFAYGLSHEFNNPLANIATRAGILAETESDETKKRMLTSMVESAMRGCDMLGDLMLIARPPQIEKRQIAADEFLDDLVQQTKPWAAKWNITVTGQFDLLQNLVVDETAMREALWCLLRNSLEACGPDGNIRVLSRRTSDDRIEIAIEDDGAGLSEEALRYGCDPYYSGREAGRGLGLGLTKAKRIIELHEGHLSLRNLPGGGASAIVDLPT